MDLDAVDAVFKLPFSSTQHTALPKLQHVKIAAREEQFGEFGKMVSQMG